MYLTDQRIYLIENQVRYTETLLVLLLPQIRENRLILSLWKILNKDSDSFVLNNPPVIPNGR